MVNRTIRAVAADATGTAYLTGVNPTTYTFAGRTYTTAGKGDVWVARVDPWGRALWVHMWGGPETEEGRAVAVDGASVYVAGIFQSASFSMGGLVLTGAGLATTTDVFVAQLRAATGEVVWARAFGTEAVESPVSLAAAGGAVWLAGLFQGPTLALDGFVVNNPNNPAGNSSFLAALDASTGAVASADAFADMPSLSRMARDGRTGAIYFVGTDYVARLGSWRTSLGTSSTWDTRRGLAIDPASQCVFVAGMYNTSTLVLGGTTLPNPNKNSDSYVARFDAATGVVQWATRVNGGGQEFVVGCGVDPYGGVYVAGM